MSVLPNLIYIFNATPTKSPISLFVDIDKLILKFIQKGKRSRIYNINRLTNKQTGEIPATQIRIHSLKISHYIYIRKHEKLVKVTSR